MPDRLKLAVVGLGRMGSFHVQHIQELTSEGAPCELVAVVDADVTRARGLAEDLGKGDGAPVHAFATVDELITSGVSQASVIASPTENHREHAQALIESGQRVLLEKPLTGSLDEDRAFSSFLDEKHPNGLMLGLQRRFDAPLRHAKRLFEEGRIGRVFKFVSVMEDSRPLPEGYNSPGLLPDMSVHNVDEVLFLAGARPGAVSGFGTRLYSQRLSPVAEDYDDAFLQMWFEDDLVAQVQVSRNHVSGYRTETWVFGEDGCIHVGHFQQNPLAVVVEAYGRDEAIDRQVFALRNYEREVPEFVGRFGPAYTAEMADFVERCLSGEPFEVDHNDGLRAMEVIAAGTGALRGRESAVTVEYQGV